MEVNIIRLPRETLARKVLDMMLWEGNKKQQHPQQQQLGVCPLISIRLMQFAHGALRIMADMSLAPSSENARNLLHQTFLLDAPGIHGLHKVLG